MRYFPRARDQARDPVGRNDGDEIGSAWLLFSLSDSATPRDGFHLQSQLFNNRHVSFLRCRACRECFLPVSPQGISSFPSPAEAMAQGPFSQRVISILSRAIPASYFAIACLAFCRQLSPDREVDLAFLDGVRRGRGHPPGVPTPVTNRLPTAVGLARRDRRLLLRAHGAPDGRDRWFPTPRGLHCSFSGRGSSFTEKSFSGGASGSWRPTGASSPPGRIASSGTRSTSGTS